MHIFNAKQKGICDQEKSVQTVQSIKFCAL